jgi:hypothetical protein
MPSLATTRGRNVRDQDAKHPTKARSRRAQANEAEAKIAAGPGSFGAFADTQFAADMLRARWDVDFFCQRFLGFTPHPGQSRLFKAYITRDESRYEPRYLTIATAAGNRAGKTLGLAVVILHSVLFKMGKRPPNPLDDRAIERWVSLHYEWYHFGVHSEVAELVYYEIVRIFSGTHEAQTDGCPLAKGLGSDVADWSKKWKGEYLMVQLHPLLGGGVIHFRTTGERAIGSLGKDMDGESFDECAFEPNFPFIIDEVLHMRRLSTGGQLFLIGTMTEGLTDYADKWQEGNPDNPDKRIDSFSLRISTRENIGFGIDQKMFDRLVAGMPPYLIPQNIDGFAIESREAFFGAQSVEAIFDDSLPVGETAARGHRYVQGVDPALTYDSTWSMVLDITRGDEWRGVWVDRLSGRQTSLAVAGLALHHHNAYTDPALRITCKTAVDATGFGGKMFRDLLPIDVRMVEFGGTKAKKLGLLNSLKKAIEEGRLRLPKSGKWLGLRRQLLGYKLDDRKIEQDAVMALAVAVDTARRNPGASRAEVPFDYWNPSTGAVLSGPELIARLKAQQSSRS